MTRLRNPVVLVFVLIAASLVAYAIGHGAPSLRWGGIAVLGIAGLKAAIILEEFMESRAEPRALRLAVFAWLAYVLTVVALPIILG